MKALLLLAVLCGSLLMHTPGAHASGVITLTGQWTGGWCAICGFATGEYACSTNFGNWDNGYVMFMDPIPAGNVVTQVTVTIEGQWGCDFTDDMTTLQLLLQGTPVAPAQTLAGECWCGQCDPLMIFTSTTYPAGWPNYIFASQNQQNALQLIVQSGITCVAYWAITLTYAPGSGAGGGNVIPPPPTCPGTPPCNGNGQCVVTGPPGNQIATCDCNLGWGGPACTCQLPVYDLITNYPPVLDVACSGFKVKDTLRLCVNNAAIYYDTTITFKNAQSNVCNFPYAVNQIYWDPNPPFDQPDCLYNLQGNIPWGIAWPDCVFSKDTSDPNQIVFTGEMHVDNTEKIPPIHGVALTREVISVLTFQVIFPTNVDVASPSAVRVYAPIDVQAAIVEQSFTWGPSMYGQPSVVLEFIVQWPFMIDQASWGGSVNNAHLGLTLASTGQGPNGAVDNCVDNSASQPLCSQFVRWNISYDNTMCDLNADYTLTFNVLCDPSQLPNNCPINPYPAASSVTFTLQTSEFCAQIIQNIDLTGTLAVYQDPNFITPKTVFFQGDTLYFLGQVASNTATIIAASFAQLWATDPNNVQTLLYATGGGNTPTGAAVSLTIINAGLQPYQCAFSLVADPSYFNVPVDNSLLYTFQADIDVTFANTQGVKEVKKMRAQFVPKPQATEQSGQITASTQIQGQNPSSSNTGAASTVGPASALVAGAIGLATVAALL